MALTLKKGLDKLSPYIKVTGKPAIALVDSKPIVQAKQRMDDGKFSSNRRLQDLLANFSFLRVSIQHISAKLPSALLKMIDFNSRNPVTCEINDL